MLQNNSILSINKISISQNNKEIINNLSFKLFKNNIYSIIESNNKKDLIFELLLGYCRENCKINSGEIILSLNNKQIDILSIDNKSIQEIRRKNFGVFYKKSDIIFISIEKIGIQMINLILLKSNKKKQEVIDEIKYYMNYFNIPFAIFSKYPKQIKNPIKKILSFILLIIIKPDILLLEEPFDTDIIIRNKMINLINKNKQFMTTLILTSDILLLKLDNFIDRAFVLNLDTIIEGDPNTIINSENHIIKSMIKKASFTFI